MSKKIPKGVSLEEEAKFWDETELTEVLDQLAEVEVTRTRKPTTTFAIRLDPDAVALLRRVAQGRKVGPTQLARSWLMERLRLEVEMGSLAEPTSTLPADAERQVRDRVLGAILRSIPDLGAEAMDDVFGAAPIRKRKATRASK